MLSRNQINVPSQQTTGANNTQNYRPNLFAIRRARHQAMLNTVAQVVTYANLATAPTPQSSGENSSTPVFITVPEAKRDPKRSKPYLKTVLTFSDDPAASTEIPTKTVDSVLQKIFKP